MNSSGGVFATTHWNVVLAAKHAEVPGAAAALEELCRTYWYPLYAHVRRGGFGPEDSCDLTQEFFARLLQRDFLKNIGPERGRFRSYLLTCLNHLLADEWDRSHAAKRGFGIPGLSLDAELAEGHYRNEPADGLTPDVAFERRWVAALLARAQSRMEAEYTQAGKSGLLEQLKDFPLFEKSENSFHDSAVELGVSDGALKSAVHRMRQRYRELVREEIAHTVGDPSEVEDEIRHLITVVQR